MIYWLAVMAFKKLPIDLLMFDFDGTLADSIPPAIEAIQKMIAKLGLPTKSKEEIHHFVGFGEVPLVAGAIGSSEPALLAKAMELYYKYYVNEGFKKVVLYPHVQEILELYKDKIKVIVSNKRDAFITGILDNFGLTAAFDHIYGGDTAPCLKPDPCTLIKVMKEYKIKPERALFVGDMTVDIETGKNAGTHTCAVTFGFDNREKLKAAKPDFLIDDIIELRGILE